MSALLSSDEMSRAPNELNRKHGFDLPNQEPNQRLILYCLSTNYNSCMYLVPTEKVVHHFVILLTDALLSFAEMSGAPNELNRKHGFDLPNQEPNQHLILYCMSTNHNGCINLVPTEKVVHHFVILLTDVI